MVSAGPPVPPPGRDGVTFPEIAAHYGLTARYVAENARWGRHPEWPARVGKRGKSGEYDPSAVEAFVAAHHTRVLFGIESKRSYTVKEIAAVTGLAADTIYADISRERWPAPDQTTEDGTRLWFGQTISRTMTARRSYRGSQTSRAEN
ncbi:hypothetical protein OG285_32505 [Streptomyces sp. NBC_01471]|uniref:hypothetical protein n=1 Tax=Streptomyces sp. NBC_01471 TaxID=2903879 RepID=UPI0032496288